MRIAEWITNAQIPFALPSAHGALYGWSIHEALHNPELETVEFFRRHLRSGDRVADVGANIGYYTLLFSDLVGKEGKVVAFEPSPRAYKWLTRAVSQRGNVECLQKGVYSENRTLNLYSKRSGDGMASVVYKAGDVYTPISLIPLRDHPERFTWVKIDVEGAELEVLRGMREPVQGVLEAARGIQEQHGCGLRAFLSDIESMGYEVHFIVESGNTVLWNGNNLHRLVSNIYVRPHGRAAIGRVGL